MFRAESHCIIVLIIHLMNRDGSQEEKMEMARGRRLGRTPEHMQITAGQRAEVKSVHGNH